MADQTLPKTSGERSKRRPRLPIELDKLNAALRREIEAAPDDLISGKLAVTVAETIIEQYAIPRRVWQAFVREHLIGMVLELLEPPKEDDDAGAL